MSQEITSILSLVATIVALGAFGTSWQEIRRSNKVLAKLVYFACTYDGGYTLKIRIKNCGVALQNISLSLGYHGPNLSGYFNIPFELNNKICESKSILRGTTVEYFISIKNKQDIQLLDLLQNIKTQKPEIILFNNGFLSFRFFL